VFDAGLQREHSAPDDRHFDAAREAATRREDQSHDACGRVHDAEASAAKERGSVRGEASEVRRGKNTLLKGREGEEEEIENGRATAVKDGSARDALPGAWSGPNAGAAPVESEKAVFHVLAEAVKEADAVDHCERPSVGTEKGGVHPADEDADGAEGARSLAMGVAQGVDESVAADFAGRAAEGDREAMFNLGVCFEEGRGVSADHARALHWYTRAAALGDPDAAFAVGVCLHEGIGAAADPAVAMSYWRAAAAAGNADACYILGIPMVDTALALFSAGQEKHLADGHESITPSSPGPAVSSPVVPNVATGDSSVSALSMRSSTNSLVLRIDHDTAHRLNAVGAMPITDAAQPDIVEQQAGTTTPASNPETPTRLLDVSETLCDGLTLTSARSEVPSRPLGRSGRLVALPPRIDGGRVLQAINHGAAESGAPELKSMSGATGLVSTTSTDGNSGNRQSKCAASSNAAFGAVPPSHVPQPLMAARQAEGESLLPEEESSLQAGSCAGEESCAELPPADDSGFGFWDSEEGTEGPAEQQLGKPEFRQVRVATALAALPDNFPVEQSIAGCDFLHPPASDFTFLATMVPLLTWFGFPGMRPPPLPCARKPGRSAQQFR